jgi:hypothetical protein
MGSDEANGERLVWELEELSATAGKKSCVLTLCTEGSISHIALAI